ncbi:helix-turn-helix domain-containing protein [Planobispora rosea]|uniref:helix-turn-helix domain-containing protein n=1 Tax=Planobispora rosea TaxID=35762 RepID=UPI00083B0681|nr:helix-turn-helix transcriptional regulator [Planobispora rosea]
MDDQSAPRLTLGRFLDAARADAHYSLRGLAQATGIPMSSINRLLKDEVAAPSAANLMRLAVVLNLDPADVFAHAGITPPAASPDLETLLRTEHGLPDEAIDKIKSIIAEHADQREKQA